MKKLLLVLFLTLFTATVNFAQSMSDEDVIVNMAAELYKLNDINRQKNATYKWALRSFSAALIAIGVICMLFLLSVV